MGKREIGVERWQYDLWYRIVEAALGDTPEQVRLDDLPGFGQPAVSRYASTTPALLRWFDGYNRGKPYREQVKPFNFLLSYQPHFGYSLKPVSVYARDPQVAPPCFDRETGNPVPADSLRSYEETLPQYHLHPEEKFRNGDYTDQGTTGRRHVLVTALEHIGKEANRWEEQYYLGLDLDAQTQYGTSPEERERTLETVRAAGRKFGQRKLAEASGNSLSDISAILCSKRKPTPATLAKLSRAVSKLERDASEDAEHAQELLDAVRRRCQLTGLRNFAQEAGIDPANLSRVLTGRRKPGRLVLAKLQETLAQEP